MSCDVTRLSPAPCKPNVGEMRPPSVIIRFIDTLICVFHCFKMLISPGSPLVGDPAKHDAEAGLPSGNLISSLLFNARSPLAPPPPFPSLGGGESLRVTGNRMPLSMDRKRRPRFYENAIERWLCGCHACTSGW